ncbi:type IV secretory system conjugative DNA transfer family protein [Elizabethkingia ursingii]
MRNNKKSLILLALVFSVLVLLIIISVIIQPENPLHVFLVKRKISELQMKLYFLLPLLIIGYYNTPYSEKKINIENSIILGLFSLGLFLLPFNTLNFLSKEFIGVIYFLIGICLIISAFTISAYLFSLKIARDQFNVENQTFEQSREIIETTYSLNFKHVFYWNNKKNEGYINIINVFTGVWIFGIMSSGKSFTWFLQAIYQFIKKDFTLAIYDYKFPEQTNITYKIHQKLNSRTEFFTICLSNVQYSNRVNPVAPKYIETIQDIEVISSIIVKKNSSDSNDNFFEGSAQGIFTALIYLLKSWERKYDLEICSIPHAMLLSTVKIDFLLPLILTQKSVLMQVTSLRDAFTKEDAGGQLAGQVASLSVVLRSLVSLDMLYILSGNDFDLELNNIAKPKILCIGTSQDKAEVSAPIISVIFEMISRKTNVNNVNKKSAPFMILADEFARITFKSLNEYLSSGRSNKCGIMAGMQGIKQLEENIPKNKSSAILDISANVICGKAGNDTAQFMADRLGKTNQKKTNVSESELGEISLNHSIDKDYLVAPSRISTMGVGEFCGVVVDDFDLKIKQKRFFGDVKVEKEVTDILKAENTIPKKLEIPKERIEKLFEVHKNEIDYYNFIAVFRKYLETDIKSKSYIFEFYWLFLDIDNDFIFQLREKTLTDEFEKAIYERLKNKIEKYELSNFLISYEKQMYTQIEKIVKLEYLQAFGKPITDDLFNVENKEDIIIEDDDDLF